MSTPLILGNDFTDQYSISVIHQEGSCTIDFGDSNRRMPLNNSVSQLFLDKNGHALKLHILNSSAKSTHQKNQRFKCKTKSGNTIGIYDLPSKLLFPLKLPLWYPFLPIFLLAQTAYMLRRFSQLIRTPMMSTCRPTLWFSRKILACMLWISLPPLSWFKLAKCSGKDITWIPGLTAWENTPLRTSRKFMCTPE